jgi:hypothetical protein
LVRVKAKEGQSALAVERGVTHCQRLLIDANTIDDVNNLSWTKALQLTDYTGIPQGGMKNIAVTGGTRRLEMSRVAPLR